MLFHVSWEFVSPSEENQHRSLAVLSKWQPPTGADFKAFSSLERIGFTVKRSQGPQGAVVRASVAALSTSITAKPPFPPANA